MASDRTQSSKNDNLSAVNGDIDTSFSGHQHTKGQPLPAAYGGGLSSLKSYSWNELITYLPDNDHEIPALQAGRYEVVGYVHRDAVADFEARYDLAIHMRVPLPLVCKYMLRDELRSIAKLHDIWLSKDDTKPKILEKIEGHAVCETCENHISVFIPCSRSQELLGSAYRSEYTQKFAPQVKSFSLGELQDLVEIPRESVPLFMKGGAFVTLEETGSAALESFIASPHYLVSDNVPWYELGLKGSKQFCHYLAKLHGIPLLARTSKPETLNELQKHECAQCKTWSIIYRPLPAKKPRAKKSKLAPEESEDDESEGDDDTPYPPSPLSDRERVDIIRSFCDGMKPECFQEAGCTVCGQLTLLTELTEFPAEADLSEPLIEPGLMRVERASLSDPISYVHGPVRDLTLDKVCTSCLASLRKGKRPVNALANGLWVGQVPEALHGLTFAEQILIARVRSNRCVIRVASGQSKMTANAISFPCPTLKVYQHLPPPKEEIDEVLAFIFTGISPPTEQDLERTPMFVRRNKVGTALNWLKLNHCDYADLHIDQNALQSYPEAGIPVKVIFRSTDDGSNVIASATSMHEVVEEEGNAEGPCPFKVNGLVGANLETMTMAARRASAIQHINSGGHVLAIGHSDIPESIYDNPQLYPQMYPWLFPYGLGGIGNARLKGLVSEAKQKKLLLMYHDKRFQLDCRFVIIAFNHEQIRRGTTSSFVLAKRSNFEKIVNDISKVKPAVIESIAARLRDGEHVVPKTDDEKLCFYLMDQIDHVGVTIQGSMAGKKNMRNELWSLIVNRGAPGWFVTMSPVDHKHPICLYWADLDIEFKPDLRDYNDRVRLIAANPVAGARFFNFMVRLFISCLLRWGGKEPERGLFGQTDAFYGTVEQQGRMTLHLHMLVWVKSALSPQEVRDRLLADDSEFKVGLINYLESCQQGEFCRGDMEQVKENFRTCKEAGMPDPAQVLPSAPPKTSCEYVCSPPCPDCQSHQNWLASFHERVDNVLYSSNVHSCYARRDVVANGVHKQHLSGKGCINKDGVCTARFPRTTFEETQVDDDGHINMKKKEEWINTVNHVLSFCLGCNTDVSSLLSGTAVKATAGYVADYLVKLGLRSYQIFSTVYDVFERNSNIWNESKSDSDAARRLILKMANSLTSKIEIGAPMAAMYLLDHPDHYSSHTFVTLYWRPFVTHVMNEWSDAEDDFDLTKQRENPTVESSFAATGPEEEEPAELTADCDVPREQPNVQIARSGRNFVAKSSVDDYRFRPDSLSQVSLYDWIQCAVRKPLNMSKNNQTKLLRYQTCHPQYESHGIDFDIRRMRSVVPNLLGGYLPRHDSDDKDFYSATMLTFFESWRSGLDLKSSTETWTEAFERATFSDRHRRLIANMAIRYECYDARDDFHAQLKLRAAAQKGGNVEDEEVEHENPQEEFGDGLDSDPEMDVEDHEETGRWTQRKRVQMDEAESVLHQAGWAVDGAAFQGHLTNSFRPERNLAPSRWRDIVAEQREKIFNDRGGMMHNATTEDEDMAVTHSHVINDARVIPGSYLLKDFQVQDQDINNIVDHVLKLYGLNTEQCRAFRIIANHSISVNPEPLHMYIGGMGGTGKTRVIDALKYWFKLRGETYRMVVLAPTGAAASIINGSTYHSFLAVATGERRKHMDRDGISLGEAKKRMRGVEYIFLDEISMVSCQDFHLIDSRLKDITEIFDVSFGGINMIVAGDFAQLPPAGKGSYSLYSGEVSKVQVARQVQFDQENTLGMLLWHQFVTVVILKTNMRQKAESPEDKKLRRALENMRFKSCTEEDITFLHSLVPSVNPDVSVHDEKWRYVSVITPLNAHKDRINEMNAKKFATEHQLVLHHFYSVDKKSQGKGGTRKPKSSRTGKSAVRLTRSVQRSLWNSAPFTSELIPACISLCLGMPVMIRNNDATELCITKGQEATVEGWTSHEIPDWPGYRTLDILFVKLVKPPKNVKLPYLPVNVVPLMKNSTSIQATLPNDQVINISRQQVPVLLNFAMTDYASQGKTRDVNIVDLKESRSHQAMYTALSRGKYAHSTMILRPFASKKITGGLSGFLRQEFRELDILDTITDLQYHRNLPEGVVQRLRGSTIASYNDYLANPEEWISLPETRKSALKRKAGEGLTDEPQPDGEPNHKRIRVHDARTVNDTIWGNSGMRGLQSWTWDSVDWSCAYDSFFTVLRTVWMGNPIYWGNVFTSYGILMEDFSKRLEQVEKGSLPLVQARDGLRKQLSAMDYETFPTGATGTDVFGLGQVMLGLASTDEESFSIRRCEACERTTRADQYESIGRYTMMRSSGEQDWSTSAYLKRLELTRMLCGDCGGDTVLEHSFPPMICLQIYSSEAVQGSNGQVTLSPVVNLSNSAYRLSAVVYYSADAFHFTARVIDVNGEVLRYDGMTDGGRLVLEGMLTRQSCHQWLSTMEDRVPVMAVYTVLPGS